MALFINEATSSLADFLTKLDAFLTTSGGGNPAWTAEDVDGLGNSLDTSTGEWAISKTDSATGEHCEVAFQWDTGSPNNLGIYQYNSGSGPGNYNNANSPWAQTGDSGNGAASTTDSTLATSRYVPIGNSPIQYWAFAGDTYAHIVVEVSSGEYRHFGFGVLDVFNDWTGGAYAYGWRYQTAPGASDAHALEVRSTHLLDGRCSDSGGTTMSDFAATIRCVNLPNQPASGLWAVHSGSIVAGYGQDRQGTPRDRVLFSGGFRQSPEAGLFGLHVGTITAGNLQTYPIVSYYIDENDGVGDDPVYPMGLMRDVRGISLKYFEAQQTVEIGGDTWHIFPSKNRVAGSGATVQGSTGFQGIAYKEN